MKRNPIRNDIFLILGVLLAAGGLYLAFHAFAADGQWAVLEQNGMEIARLSLYEEQSFPVATQQGSNVICTGNGQVWMESADCPDGLCLKEGKISATSSRIVCLPHRLVIRIEGADAILDDIAN